MFRFFGIRDGRKAFWPSGRAGIATVLLIFASAPANFQAVAATSTPEWTFVSSPDWLNTDIADLSGATSGVPAAPGWADGASDGRNGVTPAMEAVYGQIVAEMAADGPELFVVAGDLINGRWYDEAFLDMFAPVTRSREAGISAAGGVYYRWYRSLLGQYGLGTVIGAVGDHELGDDPWPAGDEKSVYLGDMRSAFAREIVDVLPLAPSLGGVPVRPAGTAFAGTSYAHQHRNVLFVSVDVFRQPAIDTDVHPILGTVVPSVEGAHLDGWSPFWRPPTASRASTT